MFVSFTKLLVPVEFSAAVFRSRSAGALVGERAEEWSSMRSRLFAAILRYVCGSPPSKSKEKLPVLGMAAHPVAKAAG